MRRAVPITTLAAITATVATTAAPAPAATLTCRSGSALYERYDLQIRTTENSHGEGTIFGCSRQRRAPARLHFDEPGITTDTVVFDRFGDRQAFGFRYGADESGGFVYGWWNLRTGETARAELGSARDFAPPVENVVMAADGDTAVAIGRENDDGDVIGWEIAHRPYSGGKLGRERRVVRNLALADLDPATLRLSGDTLTWRTQGELRGGQAAGNSVGGNGRRATRAPRAVNCGAGDTLYGDLQARIFRVRRPAAQRGVYACRRTRKAIRPVRITREASLIDLIERRGERVAFRVRSREPLIAWFHATRNTATFAPAGEAPVLALAVDGRTGNLAYVTDDAAGPAIHFRESDGLILGAAELIAREPIEPHTLATAAGKVSWRAPGQERSAPAD